MLTYVQSTGELLDQEGDLIGTGYSGKGDAKNTPAAEDLHNLGPIPEGTYTMGSPVDTMTHGPFVLPLTPAETNIMYGRSAFLLHGDSIVDPGNASEGCIIMARTVRERASQEPDHLLKVISGG